MPIYLPARRKLFLFSSIVLALILISLLYIYYLQYYNNSEEAKDTANRNTYYTKAGNYIHLFNEIPSNIIEEIKALEPWVFPSCKYCSNSSLQIPPSKLYHQLNFTLEKLIGECKNTLWEEYVSFLAYSYWLGIYGMIKRSEKYLQKGDAMTGYHYARVAYSYLELLEKLNGSRVKPLFCQISREQFREKTFEIYRELKRKLLDKYSVAKKMITKINISNTRYRIVASVIAHRISRELEENSSLITNESIFTYILHRNSVEALDIVVNTYFIVSLYLEVIVNTGYINDPDKYFSNYSYVKETYNTIIGKLEALANKEISRQEKLMVRHVLLRVIVLHFRTIAQYIGEMFKENNYINETGLLIAFLEDANFALRVIEFLAIPHVIDEIAEIIVEE